jgi:16S rRNA (uracil1498-N3)-methyltransferase
LTSTHFIVKTENLDFPHAVLDGDEHYHLSRVLRAKPGRRVWLVDERGVSYLAEVEDIGRSWTRLRLIETPKSPARAGVEIILAQSVLKSKKMDLIVQKATELGMRLFMPVLAERSVVRVREREARLKVDRWRKIAREAAKQSRCSYIPGVLPPIPLRDFLAGRGEQKKLILCEGQGKPLTDIIADRPASYSVEEVPEVLLLVGPEGGWTASEVKAAREKGFEEVTLGRRILRSETAVLAALAVISQFWDG